MHIDIHFHKDCISASLPSIIIAIISFTTSFPCFHILLCSNSSVHVFVYHCLILITIILPLFILIGNHAVDQQNVKTIVLVLIRLSLSCKSEYFKKFSIFNLHLNQYSTMRLLNRAPLKHLTFIQ